MASFAINDAASLMNSLLRQSSAQTDITVVDHQTFIDAGTTVLATGTENVLNSIYKTITEVLMQSRKYNGKFGLINATENKFNTRMAKVAYYSADNEPSGAFNTDLYTNIADGYDNGTNGGASLGTMWEQKLPKVVERFFYKSAVFDRHWTTPLAQLQDAFRSEEEFVRFWNGVLTEIENDLEQTEESKRRAVVADRIAGTYALVQSGVLGAECAVDLIALFNKECGTSYTRDEILREHLTEFMEIFTADVKIISDRMTERTTKYHDPMTITENGIDYNVLGFTPKDKQKLFLFGEFISKAKTRVMPELFNEQYLSLDNYENVTYWQSSKDADRMKIICKPALPNGATSNKVELDYVVGMLFDDEALQTITQFTGSFTTPVEARKLYTNTWNHYKFGCISDYIYNTVIFYLGEGGTTETFTGDGVEDDFVIEGEVREILGVYVNGTEVADTDYTFDADTNTITFSTAPADEAVIEVWYK